MDDELVLNMFSNARKSRISKKQFNDVPMRDSSKLLSINRISDSLKDANCSLQPKHTEAFQNVMRGIMDLGKRIDDKYSAKKIESSQAIGKKNDKWKIDKINQQKGQDGQTTKEDKAVGTSLTYIQNSTYQPYFPMRSISPNVSRVIVHPDHSRINYPPQIIQVRPLSMPKPYPIQISEVHQRPERQVFIGPLSPTRVISHQPILKRSLNVSQISPLVTSPHFHHRNPHVHGNLGKPVVNFTVVNQPQQIPQNIHSNLPHNLIHCGPPQNISRINPIETNRDQREKISVKLNPKQSQIKDIVANVANMSKEQIKAEAEKAGMKPQEYESCLRKQYEMFNSQNSQLLKYLSQLTQQQKKQQVNQQLIQKLASQQTNIKNITKINKVVQKNIINKQNIKNIENVHSVQNTVNTVNTHNSLTQNNFNNMSAIQQFNGNNLMMIQANDQNSFRQPLQTIPQNIHQNMESRRSSTKLGSMPTGASYKKIQNLINDHKIKSNQFNMAIDSDMDKFNNFEETIQMNNKIADLDDLKDKNTKEGMQILRQMDDILNKYGQNNYNLVESRIQDKKQQPGLVNKLSRIFNRADSINVINYEPKRITESKNENSLVNSNNFLTATKQFMNDIFGMGN